MSTKLTSAYCRKHDYRYVEEWGCPICRRNKPNLKRFYPWLVLVLTLTLFFSVFKFEMVKREGFVHLPVTDGHVFTLYKGYDGDFISHIFSPNDLDLGFLYLGYRPDQDDHISVIQVYVSNRLKDPKRFPKDLILTYTLHLRDEAHVEFVPGN